MVLWSIQQGLRIGLGIGYRIGQSQLEQPDLTKSIATKMENLQTNNQGLNVDFGPESHTRAVVMSGVAVNVGPV